jgi:hypothetical protein
MADRSPLRQIIAGMCFLIGSFAIWRQTATDPAPAWTWGMVGQSFLLAVTIPIALAGLRHLWRGVAAALALLVWR